MPPKHQRRMMTQGRIKCSVEMERRRMSSKKKGLRKKPSISREPPAPTGLKFRHKRAFEGKANFREQWAEGVTELGVKGIRKEFVSTIKGFVPEGSVSAWENEKNFEKNRFEDIRLLDKTRVVIQQSPENDDYIHASHVQADNGIKFICAQGPLTNTVEQFWIMVMQEEVKVILQLCEFVENGKDQCTEYYPHSDSKTYGSVSVLVTEKPTRVLSMKKVTRTQLQITFKGAKREVHHILYAGWPDHCVAESPAVCRDVRKLVFKLWEKKPVLVHCSAGIGRTGTFVGTEMVVQKLMKNEQAVVSDIIKTLRCQRMGAVQNDQQYLFVFRMTLEILISEDLISKNQSIVNFLTEYDELIQRKKAERMRKSTRG